MSVSARSARTREIVLICATLALAASYTGWVERGEDAAFAALSGLVPAHEGVHRVSVVQVQAPDGGQREAVADLLPALRQAEPAAIGLLLPLDTALTPPGAGREALRALARRRAIAPPPREVLDRVDPDGRLAREIARATNVVLARDHALATPGAALDALGDWFNARYNAHVEAPLSLLAALWSSPPPLVSRPGRSPLPDFVRRAARVGAVLRPPVQVAPTWTPLVIERGEGPFTAFAAELTVLARDGKDGRIAAQPGGVAVGSQRFPTLVDHRVYPRLVRPGGAAGGPVQEIDAETVRAGEAQAALRDKVVIIGAAHDPAIWFQAAVVAGLLSDNLIGVPAWYHAGQRGLIVLLLGAMMLFAPHLCTRGGALTLLGVVVLGANAVVAAYLVAAMRLPLVLPLAAGVFAFAVVVVANRLQSLVQAGHNEATVARLQLARYLREAGSLDESFAQLESCRRTGIVARPLYELGLAFERKRAYEKAAEVYDFLVGIDAEFLDARERQKRLETLATRFPGTGPQARMQSTPLMEATGLELPMLGHYRLQRKLGSGAMGIVYQATDTRLGRDVALKTLSLDDGFSEEAATEARGRFGQEAKLAAKLKHPNIITVYEVGDEGGLAYIAMDFFDGGTLEPFTDPDYLLPVPDLLRMAARVARALHYAHGCGIVHRDIKPGNILYREEDGEMRLTDLGIARFVDEKRTQTGTILGTPSYLSPEQASGRQVDGRTDLYALGVVLYQLSTGFLPLVADSTANLIYKITTEEPLPPRDRNPDLPPALDEVIRRALAKDPAARFQDGEAMAQALEACGGSDEATEIRLVS